MKKVFNGYKNWALVTGAASGMGRVYARRLAMMGYNIVAVDINAEKLDEAVALVRAEVEASPDLPQPQREQFKVLPVVQDLSLQDAADNIYKVTEGLPVEVLVNNAGIMYCQGIAETSEKMLGRIMMVHMYTPLMLCRKYVGQMKERGRGYILNISSISAWMIWPGIGMYGTTKRFVKDYSRELRIECRGTGVSVTNAYFGAVDTPLVPLKDKYRRLARALAVMITPEKAASKALKATFRRRRGVVPGLLNKIFIPLCALMPDCILSFAYRKAKPYLMKV